MTNLALLEKASNQARAAVNTLFEYQDLTGTSMTEARQLLTHAALLIEERITYKQEKTK